MQSAFGCGGGVVQREHWDLTRCFEERVVLLIPLALLFLASVVRIWALSRENARERTVRSLRLLLVKQILLVFVIVLSLSNAAVTVALQDVIPFTSIGETVAFLPAPFLTRLNHLRTRRSSSILLLFWPVYLLLCAVWTRTVISAEFSDVDKVTLALRWSLLLTGLVSFILEYAGSESWSELAQEQGQPENPVVIANIFQIWDFAWLTPMMAKGAKDYLEEEDLPTLPPWDRSRELGGSLIDAKKKHGKLWKALFASYGAPYAVAAGLKIVQDALAFLQPQLLRWLLIFIADYQRARNSNAELPSAVKGFSIVAVMFLAAVCQTVILHQYFQRCFETGMRVRAGLIVVIYEKALRLSNTERGRSSGDIVNLQSVDATKLQDLCTYALIAISGPVQIALAFISLFRLLGWPSVVGVAIMVLSIPLQTMVANYLKKLQEKQMKSRDERTRFMSELIANINSIKLFAWENAFMRRILSVRNDKELRTLRKYGIATAFNTSLWSGIPLLVAFSSFTVAALTSSKPLTSDVIFPAISLFNLLSFPLAMFATVIGNLVESLVSVRRISEMLDAEELQMDARTVDEKPLKLGDEVLVIQDGEFAWSRDARQPTLEGINVTVRKGELLGIWGPVGAGKTSVLSAICGEMIRLDGKVGIHGSIAYAPQTPWIMSGSIKDNILFSHEYDEQFYNMVLDACALRPDLDLFSDGDDTIVGEKGITLSGGQRARVGLARAVYSRADLVLLDDILAALDSHVARHVVDHVLGHQGLLATKARVVVTHSIAHIKHFDSVLYLRRGVILDSGPVDEVLAREESELSKLIRGHGNDLHVSGRSTPRSTVFSQSDDETGTAIDSANSDSPTSSPTSTSLPSGRRESFSKAKLISSLPLTQPAEMTKEHREKGRVKWQVYMTYARASSGVAFSFFVVMCILQQGLVLISNLTLRTWGERNAGYGDNTGAFRYVLLYGLWCLLGTLAGLISSIAIWVVCGLRSARRLHDSMLHALLRLPLGYFAQTSSGILQNRFSRDVFVIDQVLPRVLQAVVRTLCVTLGIVFVVGIAFPIFLVAVIPLLFFYVRTTQYYLATSRELKRLDAVSRSPIFSWFSESLTGLSTIRAYQQEAVFASNNFARINRNTRAYLPSVNVNRWLSVRLEFVGAVIILVSSALALVALITSGVDAGLVGLVLSYALSTTSSLNWVVRSVSELETNITSVERIIHQTEVRSEAPEETDTEPHDVWPSHGAIEFKDYNMRYRPELDLVLRDIDLKIEPGQRVGLCGRTGSGKSSLLLALFRVLEADSGSICIDGVDTSSVGLRLLRSSLSIVPQSPELFEGTLRFNIDPNEEYQDADIWVALGQAHLREYVEGLEGKLDHHVTEGGGSMSSGQRQLLCFARALLRNCKILILDEATSAVDLDTDKNIQDIIKAIPNVTLLCVAHRLNTIINYDKIVVLDAGKVIECDSPQALLADTNSTFYSLAREAGLAE